MHQHQATKFGLNLDTSYLKLPQSFYTVVKPNPVPSPKLAVLNEGLANSLGLSSSALRSEEGIAMLAGNEFPEGSTPLAQAYAGHQFGHFTMLGDGRAMLIGEHITPDGKRFDLQLKGSGRTPYSRGGDGRATLGPMLREYIISEAMSALGIPTTRILAVATTGENVVRDTVLPGAILTRVAESHIRVGTFQYAAAKGNVPDLQALADYTIHRHYRHIEAESAEHNKYLLFLKEVIARQAKLIAKWQLVGFIHGVMNTDNMAISGETIDYGPCAFMDTYHPNTVFSSIDTGGRYAYDNQPKMAGWNLTRFAEALLPLLHEDQEQAIQQAEDALSNFAELFHTQWVSGMCRKLGLNHINDASDATESDEKLISGLLHLMQKPKADYTLTFRGLMNVLATTSSQPSEAVEQSDTHNLFSSPEFAKWKENWENKREKQGLTKEQSLHIMSQHNPVIIPRNHLVEDALEAAVQQGEFSKLEQLVELLQQPFNEIRQITPYYTQPAPTNCNYRTFCGT